MYTCVHVWHKPVEKMLQPQSQLQQDCSTETILMALMLVQECFLHMLLAKSAHSSPELSHLLLQEL